MRLVAMTFGSAMLLGASPALPQPASTPPAAAAAAPTYSSTTSQLGTLLANPATKAVLLKHVPQMVNGLGDNLERASGMTLKEMQEALKAYSPDTLPDAKLAAIDLDLAKIPAANN